ncbi:MAG: polymerase sigma factor RpoE [Labilithrix sp.]|nr:polymerase sigma factor RpoE [Labilithrix sp.]
MSQAELARELISSLFVMKGEAPGSYSPMSLSWSGHVRADRAFVIEPDGAASPPPSAAASSPRVAIPEANDPTSRAFIELYRAHVGYVWTSARRLGVPATEADDVVQETFLRALRLTGASPEIGSERSWLFSILFRVVQHHRRSNQRRSARTADGFDLEILPGAMETAPDRCAENIEHVRILEEILDGLEPERRAVLVLAELEERPLNEIAVILGINASTATSRLRLAREQVEAAMSRRRARDGWRYK